MSTHSVERQYPCQYCGKVFKQSGNRNQHLRTHTGSKPFQCQFCDKSFAWSSSYKNHLQSHRLVQINIPESLSRAPNFGSEHAQEARGAESEGKQVSCSEEQDQAEDGIEPRDPNISESTTIEHVQIQDEIEDDESQEQPPCYRIELDSMDEEMLTVVIPTPLVMVDTE